MERKQSSIIAGSHRFHLKLLNQEIAEYAYSILESNSKCQNCQESLQKGGRSLWKG